jgi:hypothetical protein
MEKLKIYYLPSFYNEKSGGIIGFYRDDKGENIDISIFLQPSYLAKDGVTVIIAPASKRQLAKADAELLAIIKEEGNKKEG